MSVILPGSADIYLEVGGKKVAVVQSYRAAARRTERSIEAFGEREPVAAVASRLNYTLELTRLYATDTAVSDGIDFHTLSDFNLVIVKPDRRIVYTGCNWKSIDESGEVGDLVAEKITLVAAHRVDSRA